MVRETEEMVQQLEQKTWLLFLALALVTEDPVPTLRVSTGLW